MDDKVTLTAHRGYRAKYPENTMIAFKEALKLDVDGIETDVRMTADHQIVISHDADLSRTTDKSGLICLKTLEEIKQADAGIKFGEQFKGERIPTLIELLELIKDRKDIRLLLELKDYPEQFGVFAYASCRESLRLCKEYGVWGKDRLSIITFSTGICQYIRANYPRDEVMIHGFYPIASMLGSEKDDPIKYLDEVCIWDDALKYRDGRPKLTGEYGNTTLENEKDLCKTFTLMGIKPCTYRSYCTDEGFYKFCKEAGVLGYTCDDAYTCGIILDKLGLRKLKK